ncbi:MAG: hypothetical protein AAGA21_03600 [Pseudomonadota bacterium]
MDSDLTNNDNVHRNNLEIIGLQEARGLGTAKPGRRQQGWEHHGMNCLQRDFFERCKQLKMVPFGSDHRWIVRVVVSINEGFWEGK